MGFSLAGVLEVGIVVAPHIFYLECLIVDELETTWKKYKNSILISKSRGTSVYKAAVSFRVITVLITYPFFDVNKSTFLE